MLKSSQPVRIGGLSKLDIQMAICPRERLSLGSSFLLRPFSASSLTSLMKLLSWAAARILTPLGKTEILNLIKAAEKIINTSHTCSSQIVCWSTLGCYHKHDGYFKFSRKTWSMCQTLCKLPLLNCVYLLREGNIFISYTLTVLLTFFFCTTLSLQLL